MVIVTRSHSGITSLLGGKTKPGPGVTKWSKQTSTRKKKPATKPPPARPASPHGTNAPLLTAPSSSPILPKKHDPTVTTATLLEQGVAHLLSADPALAELISTHPCPIFSQSGIEQLVDPFESLVSGIISQQVSGAAARTIKARFVALFPTSASSSSSSFPTPAQVQACPQDTLRSAGLSGRKAEYVRDLAKHFLDGRLSADMLSTAPDDEVVGKLVNVRGIGNWSAEMFLMFGLKRMDVFSTGDLGIQRGMAAYLGKDVAKLKKGAGGGGGKGKSKWKYLSEEEMLRHSEKFRPYRSLFMWYMWRASEVTVDAFGKD
jgi:DNA-3-methyladenine glycosylase II